MDRPLVILDCETASPVGAPFLIELGALRVVDGEVQETFQELVLPPVPVDPESTAIHGLTEDDLRSADETFRVLERFRAWVGDDWMVAHNASSDTRILGFEYARNDLAPPPGVFLCTLELARKHLPDAPDHKLDTLRQFLDLEDGGHRALADAAAAWKVLEACMDEAGAPESAAEWLAGRSAPLTIAGRAPGAPRMSQRLRRLESAIRDGAEVTLLYGEGAAGAPSRLRVFPRFLFERRGKGYLEGECQTSGLLKTYLLEKVRKVLD